MWACTRTSALRTMVVPCGTSRVPWYVHVYVHVYVPWYGNTRVRTYVRTYVLHVYMISKTTYVLEYVYVPGTIAPECLYFVFQVVFEIMLFTFVRTRVRTRGLYCNTTGSTIWLVGTS